MTQYLAEIYKLLGADKKKLPLIFFLFFFSSLLDIIGIGLMGPYIAAIVDPKISESFLINISDFTGITLSSEKFILYSSIFILLIFTLKTFILIFNNWFIIRFSVNQQIRLSSQLMEAFLKMPYEEYLLRNSSEYIHSVQVLTREYSNAVIQSLLRLVCDGILVVAIISILAWTNLSALILLVLLLGFSVFFYDIFFRKKITLLGQKTNKTLTKMVQGINEGISGLKEIRVLGREEYFHSKVKYFAKNYGRLNALGQIITNSPRPLLELLIILFITSSICILILTNQDIASILPTIGVFAIAAIRLVPAANVITVSLIKLRNKRDSVKRLTTDVFTHVATLNKNSLKKNIMLNTDGFKKLSIKNITYTYPNTNIKVINNLSLDINHGESIGIIGLSGSGKSTLIDILLGLLSPQHGKITYNDNQLNEELIEWRRHLAFIPQDIFLLDDTLKKNIALGVDDINQKNLKIAIKKSRLEKLVKSLPKGLDTIIGERGMRLSGGQKQRIALARAFYHNKAVLILDEATSALDNETEQEIVDEIKLFKGEKTLVVVAHRLSTLMHCDKIYRIESGRIVEQGKPSEILK
jgi:ATP-binding cassette, subfamily B, bacterial PglK